MIKFHARPDEAVLVYLYRRGLDEKIQKLLDRYDRPQSLDDMIDLSRRLDVRIR